MHITTSLARSFPILLGVLLLQLSGCGSSASKSGEERAGGDAAGADSAPVTNPRDIALDAERTVRLKVFSNPPGSPVFVDLVPVRNDNEGLSLTPCEFTVPRGLHAISVERPGGRRATEQLDFQNDREMEFDVSTSPKDFDDPSILTAPLFEAAVGRSIPLATLNSTGPELDPFLSPDGLTIYFASDRTGIRGVHVATRPTPYHEFGEPKIISASSGADMPVSPSASGDGLVLVYAVPEKARLWQLTRASIEAPFDGKEITRADENAERAWRSAQLSNDALRLYWTEEGDDTMVTRAAVRSAPGKLFGKTLAFDLPGHHPHLSSDGLRQFTFDGATLHRFRRGSIKQFFGPGEVVSERQPQDYSESHQHRQFCVTDDEQWLVYCNNPRAGDLFIMRLSDGPGWGRSIIGKPIADKMSVAKVEPEEKPMPDPMPAETVISRSQPLAYTTYWASLVKLFEANNGEEAVALVKQSLAKKEFQDDRELLAWDLQLAEGFSELEREVQSGLQSLKPGAMIRVNGTRFEFVRYEGDTLHLKLKDKELTKTLGNLTPGERVSLAETGQEKGDESRALRFATFLYFQGKLHQPLAEGWFKKSGDGADRFHERLAARVLHQGKSELARGNTGAAITFLDAVAAAAGPNTEAAKLAMQKRESLYNSLEWKPIGPRKWQRDEQGEFLANASRANGSYLMSEKSYGDFELSCEWKVTEPTSAGGVYLRYGGQGKPREDGAKVHLANDPDLKKMDRFATGALFASASPSVNASLPTGKWNTLKIQARGNNVQVWINDKEVLKTTLAKGVPASGHVMLDGVAGGISYRKVLLFELPPTPSPQ